MRSRSKIIKKWRYPAGLLVVILFGAVLLKGWLESKGGPSGAAFGAAGMLMGVSTYWLWGVALRIKQFRVAGAIALVCAGLLLLELLP